MFNVLNIISVSSTHSILTLLMRIQQNYKEACALNQTCSKQTYSLILFKPIYLETKTEHMSFG